MTARTRVYPDRSRPSCQAQPRVSDTCPNPATGAYIIGPPPGRCVALLCGVHAQHCATVAVTLKPIDLAALPAKVRDSYRQAQQQFAHNLATESARLVASENLARAAAAAADFRSTRPYSLRVICPTRQLQQLCRSGAALLGDSSAVAALVVGDGRISLTHAGAALAHGVQGAGTQGQVIVTHPGQIDLVVADLRLIAERLSNEDDTYVLVECMDSQLIVRAIDSEQRPLFDLEMPAATVERGARA